MVEKVGIVGTVKLEINVEIFVELKDTNERVKAVEGTFSFAATDVINKPVRLITDTVISQESNHL